MSTRLATPRKRANPYAATRKPVLIELPPATYLTIGGQGEPGGPEFATGVGALYAVAFTVKMRRKVAGRPDYTVGKLEAQWWAEGETKELPDVPRALWNWRLLIATPAAVGEADLAPAQAVLLERGKPEAVRRVQCESLHEGRCAQVLHVGPYDQAPATWATLREFVAARGLACTGRYHEIYLNDPRRLPPERWRTILRRPVRAA